MGQIRDAFGVYHVLEILLKSADEPVTCVELYDDPDVKKFAPNVNKVSDYLGHMFRRGLLGRVTAAKTVGSQARWAYFWKDRYPAPPQGSQVIKPLVVDDTTDDVIEPASIRQNDVILTKPSIEITESGGVVTIDLPSLTIRISTK